MRFSSPLVLLSFAIPALSSLLHPSCSADAYIAVQQTLARYPLAIDSKDFASLNQVFTSDVVADYSAVGEVYHGIEKTGAGIQKALAPVITQHALTTQFIHIFNNRTAKATTYFTATLFGQGKAAGQTLYTFGKYEDTLIPVDDRWLVSERKLVTMGNNVGNVSVFNP